MGDYHANILGIILGSNLDRATIEHNDYARPRPFPYIPSENLALTAGAADTFPVAYTELIPINTYDFGDSPNMVQVVSLCLERIPDTDTYIMEFYKLEDSTYIPLGAVRTRREAAVNRSFYIYRPIRVINNDASALYGRLKSAAGGNTITFSLSVARYILEAEHLPISTGVWPTG